MEFRTLGFLETIREPFAEPSASSETFQERDSEASDIYSFPDNYKPTNIEGYQEFHNSILPRISKSHLQSSETPERTQNSDAEQDAILNEAVRFRLERVRLQKGLPRKPSMIAIRASQAEKVRVRELRKIKYCERRIEERIEELMEGLLRCHGLCGVGVEGGKVRLEKDVIRLPWHDS